MQTRTFDWLFDSAMLTAPHLPRWLVLLGVLGVVALHTAAVNVLFDLNGRQVRTATDARIRALSMN